MIKEQNKTMGLFWIG